jgi:hypothetical protein
MYHTPQLLVEQTRTLKVSSEAAAAQLGKSRTAMDALREAHHGACSRSRAFAMCSAADSCVRC